MKNLVKFFEWNNNNFGGFDKSFASHLIKYRNKWQKEFGINWNKHVSKEQMVQSIMTILELPSNMLHMKDRERNWWKYKMEFDNSNHTQTLRIFYDAELSLAGLRVNKNARNYR